MVIRRNALPNALTRFTHVEDGINKEGEILSRLASNLRFMRANFLVQPLNITVREMAAAGIRIASSWLSDLEQNKPVDISLSRLIAICNFYQVTLSECLFEDLSLKYPDRSASH